MCWDEWWYAAKEYLRLAVEFVVLYVVVTAVLSYLTER